MKILFISSELIAGNLAYKMKQEGNEVKLFIEDKGRGDCFENMVEKIDDWRKELEWVGRDGLIVFDDVGYGKIQDELRAEGYNVFGGSEEGDKLERDREYAQNLFASHGMTIAESKDFTDYDEAIKFVKERNCAWVLKQNTHESNLAYVGQIDDGRDIISIINNYKENDSEAIKKITLQKKVTGVEVAVARFFNGKDWTSPAFISFEHKPFFNEDIGPLTAEMGTLGWYDPNENNKLFTESLLKIKPYLQKIDYRGYVDINSMVYEDDLIPIEATMRFGSPTNHLQNGVHISPWGEFLATTARGEEYDLKYEDGYYIVVSLAIPPFPYKKVSIDSYQKGVEILFKKELTDEEKRMIHFEEVSRFPDKDSYYIAGHEGYTLFITGIGKTVEAARDKAYKLIDKIVIPKMMYRTDIGVKFMNRDKELLEKWGWL